MKKELQQYLYEQIPISEAMGIEVASASLDKVVLSAPLEPNINHKKTAFGGSLHAVATLACWSLLHLHLKQKPVQIVITESHISYIAPVEGDFQAECALPEISTWQLFLKGLERKGKARLALPATISYQNRLCVRYQGTFVAITRLLEQ